MVVVTPRSQGGAWHTNVEDEYVVKGLISHSCRSTRCRTDRRRRTGSVNSRLLPSPLMTASTATTARRPSYAPGAVLETRTVLVHGAQRPDPDTGSAGSLSINRRPGTTVRQRHLILRPANAQPNKVVSYQSFYDSLNPDDSPSRARSRATPRIGDWTPSGRNFNIGGTFTSIEASFVRLALVHWATPSSSRLPRARMQTFAGPNTG